MNLDSNAFLLYNLVRSLRSIIKQVRIELDVPVVLSNDTISAESR